MKRIVIKFTCALIALNAIVVSAATLSTRLAEAATGDATMASVRRAKLAKWQQAERPATQVENKSNARIAIDRVVDEGDGDDDDDGEIVAASKLNLNTKVQKREASQTELPSNTMDSLELQHQHQHRRVGLATAAAAAAAATSIKGDSMTATKRESSMALREFNGNNADAANNEWRYNNSNNNNNNNNIDNKHASQPVYELQLVVWPADIDDDDVDDDDIHDVWSRPTKRPATTTSSSSSSSSTTTTRATTTTERPFMTLYEDQLVVFPQIAFEDENFDYFFDDAIDATPISGIAVPLPTPKPIPMPPTVATTTPSAATQTIYVIDDYHIVHPNGTIEYRLELSNGLVNYKKIYSKFIDDYVVTVQEGYDSIPVPGREHEYQTQYYIADERGYQVCKMEYSHIRPELPEFLSYYGSQM